MKLVWMSIRRRRGPTAAALVALALAVLAGCGSSPSTSAATAGQGSAGAAPAGGAASYPAPAGGNGGATAPGVTATEINIGVLASVSGPLPGVSKSAWEAAQAFADYVNSIGGVYGRKLVVHEADDGLNPVTAQTACASTVPQVFAMVGSVGFGDAGCYPIVKSSGIPWIGYYYDVAQMYGLPNVIGAGEGSPDDLASGLDVYYASLLKGQPEPHKVAILWTQVAGNIASVNRETQMLQGLGLKVYSIPIPANAPNLTPYVQEMKSDGVQWVSSDAIPASTNALLSQAMTQQGFDPPLKEDEQTYNGAWGQLAGSAAAGWYAGLATIPFLNKSILLSTPGGQLFNKWFTQTNPGVPVDEWAIWDWEGQLLFLQGLIKAGPHLTRASLLAAVRSITSFDAEGLMAPTSGGSKTVSNCFVVMQANASGSFDLVEPSKPGTYQCDLGDIRAYSATG